MPYYFEKGYQDAPDEKEAYQSIRITPIESAFVISEASEVLFWDQVPNLEPIETPKELCQKMAEKGWELTK